MKVGDLVQQGTRVVRFKGRHAPKKSKRVGIVLEIEELSERGVDAYLGDWNSFLGRDVTVLWDNGKITKGFAENSLEVISDESR